MIQNDMEMPKNCGKCIFEDNDCISRKQLLELYRILEPTDTLSVYTIRKNITELSSVYPKSDKSVLEDIKTEIEDLFPKCDEGFYSCQKKVIRIINSHISRKEQK